MYNLELSRYINILGLVDGNPAQAEIVRRYSVKKWLNLIQYKIEHGTTSNSNGVPNTDAEGH